MFVHGILLGLLAGGSNSFIIGSSSSSGIDAELTLSKPNITLRQEGNSSYAVLSYPELEHGFVSQQGLPQLPVIRRIIEAPPGADVSASISVVSTGSLRLENRVWPVQAPVPKIPGAKPEFVIDQGFYSQNQLWPRQQVKVEFMGVMHGHHLWMLEVQPVSYNPATGDLSFITRAKISLSFSGGTGFIEDQSPMGQMVSSIAWNRNPGKAVPPLDIGYLIIVPDAMESSVQPLVDWKKQTGYRVRVATTSQTGTSTSSIKSYIQAMYDTSSYDLQFVLLVGDVDGVPNWPGTYANTDLYYATLESSGEPDYLPDVWIGRLSASNTTELVNEISKTVNYEQLNWSTWDWADNGYFMASDDGNYHDVAEGTHQYCMAKARAAGMECDSLWEYYGTGTPITIALNDGRSQATYSGHGGETGWVGPAFSISDIYNLNNGDMLPLVQSYACLTGSYASTDECFMEAWIRAPNKGAVAAWGSSVTSYWDEDDILQRSVYDFIFDSTVTWLNGFLLGGKMGVYQHYGNTNTVNRYFEQYNLFGDPSLDLFTLVPIGVNVLFNPIPPGPSTMDVTVNSDTYGPLQDALVCVWQKDRANGDTVCILDVQYTDASGVAHLNVTPIAVDSVFVTVTAHNHTPYTGNTMVISNEAYVSPVRYNLDDSAGNDDGIANPGETISLFYTFKNLGSQDATGVVAKLRTTDPNLTVSDSTSNIGSLAAGDSLISNDPFTFSSVSGLEDGYVAQFTMEITDDDSHSWEYNVNIVLGTPVFEIASVFVNDSDQASFNYRLDPGETVKLIIDLHDIGHGNAYGTTGLLRTSHSLVTISDSNGTWPGTILVDSTAGCGSDWFVVSADASIPKEDTVNFTLYTSTSDGYHDTLSFYLIVGQITEHDPTGPDPYGYYAYDQTDTLYTECPTYTWQEINSVGTNLNMSDDDIRTVSIPFTFKYYGTDYNQVSICSNGYLRLGSSTNDDYSNDSLPSSDANLMVAGIWDDLNPYSGGDVYYYYDATGNQFIVEWDGVEDYGTGDPNTFQIVLSDPAYNPTVTGDGEIFCYYVAVPSVADGTLGIQDNNTTNFLQYAFEGNYSKGSAPVNPPFALKYTTDPPEFVGSSETAGLPKRFSFAMAGPNPARSTAAFTLALPSKTRVSVKVYDMTGRQVAVLAQGEKEAGIYTLFWNGRSESGTNVGKGIYIVRATAGNLASSLKIIWLR